MSEFIYDHDSLTILTGIQPKSSNIEFPASIEKIIDFPENHSLIKDVNITSLSFEEGSNVTYIGNYSFAYSTTLRTANLSNCLLLSVLSPGLFKSSKVETIILPQNGTLEILSSGCLSNTNIKSISIPDSVITIGDYEQSLSGVFGQCWHLKDIIINNDTCKLQKIGYLFAQDTIVYSFYVPKSVTYIANGAFGIISRLHTLNVDPENPVYYSQNNIIYSDNNTCVHTCACDVHGEINLLPTVTSIRSESFRYCRQTGSFTIPEGVTTILINTFFDALFTEIILPSTLETIGEYSFRNTHFKSITIPPSVNTIKSNAFFKSDIETVNFQTYNQNVTIYDEAFRNCGSLHSITIPQDGVVFESNNVFSGCSSLSHVYYTTMPFTIHKDIFNSNIKFALNLTTKDNNSIQSCGIIKNINFAQSCSINTITCANNHIYQTYRLFSYYTVILLAYFK